MGFRRNAVCECWRVVIGGLVSEGYQVIGCRVEEETPAESCGWTEVWFLSGGRCEEGWDEAARARARAGQ